MIPGQGASKNQPMNAQISGKQIDVSLSLSPCLPKSIIIIKIIIMKLLNGSSKIWRKIKRKKIPQHLGKGRDDQLKLIAKSCNYVLKALILNISKFPGHKESCTYHQITYPKLKSFSFPTLSLKTHPKMHFERETEQAKVIETSGPFPFSFF